MSLIEYSFLLYLNHGFSYSDAAYLSINLNKNISK